MATVKYKGFEISPATYQLADSGEWELRVVITKHHDSRGETLEQSFTGKNTFKFKEEAEANAIRAEAEEQARQMVEEKKAEATAMAEKEAEAIKADAIKHADQLPEEKTKKIQSELRDTAKRLFGELLSQFESLKQQVTALDSQL